MGYKNELVNNLSDAIKTRFQTMQSGKCVVDGTRILKLKTWLSDKEELRGLILFHVVHYAPVIFVSGRLGAEDIGDIAGLKCRDFTADESRQCRRCAGVLISR